MAAERLARILGLLAVQNVTGGGRRLCEVAAQVTATSGAGVMLLAADRPQASLCTTDPVSALIEETQYTVGEGPCIDAHRLGLVVTEPDLANATGRWPAFSARPLAAGARAVFGFPVRIGAVRMGALNLYRDRPGPLDDDHYADALVMADVAARAVLAAQADAPPGGLAGELEGDAHLWGIVHQAAGMVSVQLDVPVADALLGLRAQAFVTDRLVSEVARDVVERRLSFEPVQTPHRRRRRPRGDVMPNHELLVRSLVELADNLVEDFDVVDLLTLLSDRCVRALDVTAAGVMLAAPNGALEVVASSSEAMRTLELFQVQADEGPCIEAFRTGEAVVNLDLAIAGNRWPRFSALALGQGFHSAHSLPMRLRGRALGALNLLRLEPGRLVADDIAAAQALADIATIALIQHQLIVNAQTLNSQLSGALNSRIVIEQAKGKIAQATGVDMDEAFRRLRTHARGHNLRLVDVAAAVADGTQERLGTEGAQDDTGRRDDDAALLVARRHTGSGGGDGLVEEAGGDVRPRQRARAGPCRPRSLGRAPGRQPVGLAGGVVVDGAEAERLEPARGPGAHVSEGVPAVGDHRPGPVEPGDGVGPETLERDVDRAGEVLVVVLGGWQHLEELGALCHGRNGMMAFHLALCFPIRPRMDAASNLVHIVATRSRPLELVAAFRRN